MKGRVDVKTSKRKPAIFAEPEGKDSVADTAVCAIWDAFDFAMNAEDGPFYCSEGPSRSRRRDNNFESSGATIPRTAEERNLVRIGVHMWANIKADQELSTQIDRVLGEIAKAITAERAAVRKAARKIDTPRRRQVLRERAAS
jgi:hypothetical protein